MKLLCAAWTVYLSLRHFNPWTPLGAVMVSGHSYIGDFETGVRCERCGDFMEGVRG